MPTEGDPQEPWYRRLPRTLFGPSDFSQSLETAKSAIRSLTESIGAHNALKERQTRIYTEVKELAEEFQAHEEKYRKVKDGDISFSSEADKQRELDRLTQQAIDLQARSDDLSRAIASTGSEVAALTPENPSRATEESSEAGGPIGPHVDG